jgi:cation diffusion facilitator family transporter
MNTTTSMETMSLLPSNRHCENDKDFLSSSSDAVEYYKQNGKKGEEQEEQEEQEEESSTVSDSFVHDGDNQPPANGSNFITTYDSLHVTVDPSSQRRRPQLDTLTIDGTITSEEDPSSSTSAAAAAVATDIDTDTDSTTHHTAPGTHRPMTLRRLAIQLSLYLNLLILLCKLIAYLRTLSLSVLAALTDSLLDVVSQLVLNYTEKHSNKSRSSAFYPAGAARLEPLGVLTCAALMGMASFEILKESIGSLMAYYWNSSGGGVDGSSSSYTHLQEGENMASVYGMILIVVVKLFLYLLCRYRRPYKVVQTETTNFVRQSIQVSDPTLEALALDHWNDALSNGVAAVALFAALLSKDLWFLDPMGAIAISLYIIYSWYETGKEQIEHLTGKCAPDEFLEELYDLASNFDQRMKVDVVRAYHFGPKFWWRWRLCCPRKRCWWILMI